MLMKWCLDEASRWMADGDDDQRRVGIVGVHVVVFPWFPLGFYAPKWSGQPFPKHVLKFTVMQLGVRRRGRHGTVERRRLSSKMLIE